MAATTSAPSHDLKRAKLDPSSSSGGIVTHNGTHHADEALAVFLLRRLPEFSSMSLTRTRDPEIINAAAIVVDVGAEYDESRQRFDHHQRGFMEVFDEAHKTKLSSAGLVWKHYGLAILAQILQVPTSHPHLSILYNKLYDDFIEAIDGIDNGISQYDEAVAGPPAYKNKTDLSSRIANLNPRWNQASDAADSDKRFERASALAGSEFSQAVENLWEGWLPAREIVLRGVAERKAKTGDTSGRILLFDEFASWKEHLFALEKLGEEAVQAEASGQTTNAAASGSSVTPIEPILYVIYPDESAKWRIQAVPVSSGSFQSRKPLPEQWRGVRDQDLTDKSGIPGCIFVHASGFIGGNATRDGALQMAKKALEM